MALANDSRVNSIKEMIWLFAICKCAYQVLWWKNVATMGPRASVYVALRMVLYLNIWL